MSVIIDADYLLAIALQAKESVTYDDLLALKRCIEKECPEAVVDLSAIAIRAAVQHYPEIFERKTDCIARATRAKEYLESAYVDCEFARLVPLGVRNTVKQALAGSSN